MREQYVEEQVKCRCSSAKECVTAAAVHAVCVWPQIKNLLLNLPFLCFFYLSKVVKFLSKSLNAPPLNSIENKSPELAKKYDGFDAYFSFIV